MTYGGDRQRKALFGLVAPDRENFIRMISYVRRRGEARVYLLATGNRIYGSNCKMYLGNEIVALYNSFGESNVSRVFQSLMMILLSTIDLEFVFTGVDKVNKMKLS